MYVVAVFIYDHVGNRSFDFLFVSKKSNSSMPCSGLGFMLIKILLVLKKLVLRCKAVLFGHNNKSN